MFLCMRVEIGGHLSEGLLLELPSRRWWMTGLIVEPLKGKVFLAKAIEKGERLTQDFAPW